MHVCRVWRNMAIANCWLCQSWELKNGPPHHRVRLHVRIRVRVLASASQSDGVLSKEQQNANIIEWNIIYVLHLQSAARQQFSSRTHMLHAPHVPRKLPYTCTGRNDPSSTPSLTLSWSFGALLHMGCRCQQSPQQLAIPQSHSLSFFALLDSLARLRLRPINISWLVLEPFR